MLPLGSPADGPPPAESRVVEMDIPSDIRFIERVVEIVRRECEVMGFARRHTALNVPVALTEAVSNAILRGNRDDPAKQVHVRAEVDTRRIVLEIDDEGNGFDLAASLIDPTTRDRIDREDGRGLFLMCTLMDSVERIDVPSGNKVRMTLHRARS